MTTPIKPGTQCECSVAHDAPKFRGREARCDRPAVRMLPCPASAVRTVNEVPMCEDCAAYHESLGQAVAS